MLKTYLIEDDFAFVEKFINASSVGDCVRVVGCSSGRAGTREDIRETSPDVVIVGTADAVRIIKEIASETDVPVLLSVPPDRYDIEAYRTARNSGAVGILRRPYNVQELLDAVEVILGDRPAESPAAPPPAHEGWKKPLAILPAVQLFVQPLTDAVTRRAEPEARRTAAAPEKEAPQKKTPPPSQDAAPAIPRARAPDMSAAVPFSSVIAILSPWIPRIGVTRLAIHAAMGLASKNRDGTAIVDADLKGCGLGARLGIPPGELKTADWRLAREPYPVAGGRISAWLLDPYNYDQSVSDNAARDIVNAAGRRYKHVIIDAGSDPENPHIKQVLRYADGAVLLIEADTLTLARIMPGLLPKKRELVPCPFVFAGIGAGEGECMELADILGMPCYPLRRDGDGFLASDMLQVFSALSAEMARAPKTKREALPVFVVGIGGGRVEYGPMRYLKTEAEFKRALEETVPCAIFVSASMPGVTEFVKNLRRNFALNTVPIGVLGGTTGSAEFYNIGADGIYDILDAQAMDDLVARGRRIHAVWDGAARDDLTGCYRRATLEKHLETEAGRFAENNTPFSVIVMDIDHFKTVNDRYGHQAGDVVLREFGRFLLSSVRETDMVARYGGEEFVLVFPRTKAEESARIAEELLNRWRQKEVILPCGKALKTTFSAGVAQYGRHALSAFKIFEAADKAMYMAKQEGRNRVCCPTA